MGKLLTADALAERVRRLRSEGRTIALAVSAFRNHYTGGPVSAHFLDYQTNSLGGLERFRQTSGNGE